jgi:integrase
VRKQLGHATASITLDTYGHLFRDELDALAQR